MQAVNRTLGLTVVALAGALGATLLAQPFATASSEARVAQAAPTAIAVVDLERVMLGLEEKKTRESDMQQQIKSHQATLDELKKQLDSLDQQLKLIPETERAKRREIRQKQFETAATAEARKRMLEDRIGLDTGEILREMYVKINDAVGRIARKDGWDLVVLDNRSIKIPETVTSREINFIIQSRTVLHAADRVDITNDVITLMNNEYK